MLNGTWATLTYDQEQFCACMRRESKGVTSYDWNSHTSPLGRLRSSNVR
jgi:hypothetical protein